MNDFNKLRKRTVLWATKRGIISNGTLLGQASKNCEEAEELYAGASNNDQEEIVDALGDNMVTLILCAELAGYDILDCLDRALTIIERRTGNMVNGVFVKDGGQ